MSNKKFNNVYELKQKMYKEHIYAHHKVPKPRNRKSIKNHQRKQRLYFRRRTLRLTADFLIGKR